MNASLAGKNHVGFEIVVPINRPQDEGGDVRHHAPRSIDETILLRDLVSAETGGALVCKSAAIGAVLGEVQQVARTNATVLLLGETGVGKEVFAQAIHDHSPRRARPMVRVSCAALPSALIERELFGSERGAFTDAVSRQIGRFEAADGSTLFLDEIGDLPMDVQVKLLRVLQERTIERLGGSESIKVDIRIIAATNRNLESAVAKKMFREDLYYRLNVFPITVPPLRDRTEDVPALTAAFAEELSRTFGKRIDRISRCSLLELQRYAWPGNVRELRNVVERAVILAVPPTLAPLVPRGLSSPPVSASRLVEVQVEHILAVLKGCNWRIRGCDGAAARLGLKPTTLESRMARLGILRQPDADVQVPRDS